MSDHTPTTQQGQLSSAQLERLERISNLPKVLPWLIALATGAFGVGGGYMAAPSVPAPAQVPAPSQAPAPSAPSSASTTSPADLTAEDCKRAATEARRALDYLTTLADWCEIDPEQRPRPQAKTPTP